MATKQFMTGRFSKSSGYYAGGYDDQTSRASSSSHPPLRQNYEVFLSFSGDDTRHSFTDHLYHRLVDRGIEVFRDSESLCVGQKIDQLLEAIMASKILVPIISTHYASSEWCLKELLQILKCNKLSAHLVLPIFYKVKPSDIRDQKGQFGKEFQRFKEKHKEDINHVQTLDQAFKEIVLLKGWESDKFADGHEGELVKAVVTRIFNELRKPILVVPEFLVGVEEHAKEIMKMIDAKQSNDAKIIAIHGMGGIGKTTLAKVLYNELCDHFDSRSFVLNIREASSKYKGMEDLQKKLISDVLVDKPLREISHVDEGVTIIENSFKGKRLLLLLDDVDDKDQLNKLAAKNNWFGSESIVIVTTRNKDITKASAINLSYELSELDKDQSYELFCKHAFRSNVSCPNNLENVARGIVSTTGGLPLAIEVIGSLLYQKSEGFWSVILKKLRRIPNDKVLETLMLSYDALKYEQQQIFLDIACLSIRHMREYKYAFYMWDACNFYPEEGIEILVSLSLIKVIDNKIVIHDQLRDLGMEIVRREGRSNIGMCSRIWLHEPAKEVKEQKQGTPNIKSLQLHNFSSREFHLTSQQFEGMTNLRFLHMYYNVHLTGDFENLFSNIIWLRWGSGIDNYIDIMEINFNPRKLVILELYRTNITEHWNGWSQVKNLKVLILECCDNITTTPDFSVVGALVELVLHYCSSLKEIHPSIRKFKKTLNVLDVQGCSKLEELPIKVGEMEELRELRIDNPGILRIPIGEGIEYIPHAIESLVKLLKLDLTGSKSLINIPEAIGKLKLLTHLGLRGIGVTQLPDLIGDLYNLERLDIQDTPIKCLPACIEKLRKLQHLDLANCKEVESLSNLPCGLTSLIFNGDSMETLPDISNLTNLKHLRYNDVFERRNRALNLTKLNQLETLEIIHSGLDKLRSPAIKLDEASEDISLLLELPLGLKQLQVCGCQTLRTFPDLSSLRNLSRLTLKDCPELNCLELEGAESLSDLSIERCKKLSILSGMGTMVVDLRLRSLDALQSLSHLSASKKLKYLDFSEYSNLMEIQELEDVEGLEALRINKCCSLQRTANFSHLKMLATLELHGCEKLCNVQGIEKLTSLTNLHISEPLWDLLDFSNLKKLKYLRMSGCNNLVEIQGLEDVEGLESLIIENCCSLERIANLSHLKMLTTLRLHDCEKLSNVQGIEQLTSLTNLYISKSLWDLPDLSTLKKLKKLEISRCNNLVEIHGLKDFEGLESLIIKNCCSLERIANLSHLKMLITLWLHGCEKLSNVQGIEKLTSLTNLYISEPLWDLLDLSTLKKLKYLRMSECSNLVEIQGLEDVEGLESLIIENCCSLERIANLPHLKMLTTLWLHDCEKLSNVQGIEKLTSLTNLYISKSLWDLPDLSTLKKLQKLEISGCSNLVEIHGLKDVEGLEILKIKMCQSLERIANLSHLKMLTTLELHGCEKLCNVQGIEKLTSLTILYISEPSWDLLDLSTLKKLKYLRMSGCSNLVEIQGLEDVEGLESLIIQNCCSLERIANLSHLKMLTTLWLHGCEKLSNVQGIEKLTSLTSLYVSKPLWDFPNLSTLKKLQKLEISGCNNLVEIQGLEDVEVLEALKIKMCHSLERITNLSSLKMLTTLELHGCEKLSTVQGVENMTSLTELCISKPLLDSLDLSTLKKLKKLEISGCNNLVEIHGLEDVEGLETLKIKMCHSLERIANLSHLKMLRTLELHGCEMVSNVQGIEKLTSLTELCISEPLLGSLDLSQLTNLRRSEIIPRLPPLRRKKKAKVIQRTKKEAKVIQINLSGIYGCFESIKSLRKKRKKRKEKELDIKCEAERKEQERKRSQQTDFVSGGTQARVTALIPKVNMAIAGVATVTAINLHCVNADPRDGRQNKKSKWDKVDGG